MPRPAQMVGHRHTFGGGLIHGPVPVFLQALLVGAAILGATGLVWLGARAWQNAHATPAPRVNIVDTEVPTAPVSTLDRVYLSTRIANPSEQRLENLSVELTVVGADGSAVVQTRQQGIALDPHDTRAIYWAWRVPGNVAPGTYHTRVSVSSADGHVLSSSDGSSAVLDVQAR